MVAIAMNVKMPMMRMLERARKPFHPVSIALVIWRLLSVPTKAMMTNRTRLSKRSPARRKMAPLIVRNHEPIQLMSGFHIQFVNHPLFAPGYASAFGVLGVSTLGGADGPLRKVFSWSLQPGNAGSVIRMLPPII